MQPLVASHKPKQSLKELVAPRLLDAPFDVSEEQPITLADNQHRRSASTAEMTYYWTPLASVIVWPLLLGQAKLLVPTALAVVKSATMVSVIRVMARK